MGVGWWMGGGSKGTSGGGGGVVVVVVVVVVGRPVSRLVGRSIGGWAGGWVWVGERGYDSNNSLPNPRVAPMPTSLACPAAGCNPDAQRLGSRKNASLRCIFGAKGTILNWRSYLHSIF